MNGLWKFASDAAVQASTLGAQAVSAVTPHANTALSAAKSVQISEEQANAAKRAAEAVGHVATSAAVAAGVALAPHAENAFNTIKSVHIPQEHLDAAAVFANNAAAGVGKAAGDLQQTYNSMDPDVKRKLAFVAGGVAVGLVAPPLILNAVGFTKGGVAAGSAAAGIHAGIGSVGAGSVFAGLQSAGAVGFAPGACAAFAGLGGATGLFLEDLNKKRDRKL